MSLHWSSPHRWAIPPSSSQLERQFLYLMVSTSPFFQDTPLARRLRRRNENLFQTNKRNTWEHQFLYLQAILLRTKKPM